MNNYPSTQANKKLLLLDIFIGIGVILCACLIFVIINSDKTVLIDVPVNTSVSINNHKITSRVVKMRIGFYKIIVSSPTINPYQATLNVGLFGQTLFRPKLQQRNASAIASSVIGSVGTSGSAPQLSYVKWFYDNTWVAGVLAPGSADIALRYESAQKIWVVGFYNVAGYPDNLTSLPSLIANYIKQLEVKYD